MSVMSTINLPNNGVNETGSASEGLSPGRCPMEEQRGPGRHPATAPRIQRRKWSQEDNRIVMECYYQSEPRRNGYRTGADWPVGLPGDRPVGPPKIMKFFFSFCY